MCERTLITARNNSWEKVMFSQVSVNLFSRGISGPMSFLGCISGLMSFPEVVYSLYLWSHVLSRGWVHPPNCMGSEVTRDTFGKRAVCILLECCLVMNVNGVDPITVLCLRVGHGQCDWRWEYQLSLLSKLHLFDKINGLCCGNVCNSAPSVVTGQDDRDTEWDFQRSSLLSAQNPNQSSRCSQARRVCRQGQEVQECAGCVRTQSEQEADG